MYGLLVNMIFYEREQVQRLMELWLHFKLVYLSEIDIFAI